MAGDQIAPGHREPGVEGGGQADGREVVTVEALHAGGELHPVQQAFVDAGAVQCGFCTSGMLMAATALLAERPHASIDEIRAGLAGNICRCTGYRKIVDAVLAVASERAP